MAEVAGGGDHPPAFVVSNGSTPKESKDDDNENTTGILTEHQGDDVVKLNQPSPPSTVVVGNAELATKSSDSPFDEPDHDDSPFDEKQYHPVEQHENTSDESQKPTSVAASKKESSPTDDPVEVEVASSEAAAESSVDLFTSVEIPSTEVQKVHDPPSDEGRTVETNEVVAQEQVVPSSFSVEMTETAEPKVVNVSTEVVKSVKVEDEASSPAAVSVTEESEKPEETIEQKKENPVEEKERPASIRPAEECKEEVEKELRSNEPVPKESGDPTSSEETEVPSIDSVKPENVAAAANESVARTETVVGSGEEGNIVRANEEPSTTEPLQGTSELVEKGTPVGLANGPNKLEVERAVEAEATPEMQEESNCPSEAIKEADTLPLDSVEPEEGISADVAKERPSIVEAEAAVDPVASETIVLVAKDVDEPKTHEVGQEGSVAVIEESDKQKGTVVESKLEAAEEPQAQEIQKLTNETLVDESVEQKEMPMNSKPEAADELNVKKVNVSLMEETAVQEKEALVPDTNVLPNSADHTDAPDKNAEPELQESTAPFDEKPAQEEQESFIQEEKDQVETSTKATDEVETQDVIPPSKTEKSSEVSAEPEVKKDEITKPSSGVEPQELEAAASPKASLSPLPQSTAPTAFFTSKASESPVKSPSKLKVPALFCETSLTASASPPKSPVKSLFSGKIKIPAAFLSGSSAPNPETPTDADRIRAAEEQARKKAAEELAMRKAEEEARNMVEEETHKTAVKEEEQKQELMEEIERVEAELVSATAEKELNASREMLMEEIPAVDAELEAAKVEKGMNASKNALVDPNGQIDTKQAETTELSKTHSTSPVNAEVTPGLVNDVSKRLESPKSEKNKLVEQLHEQAISTANSEISQGEAHVKEIIEKIESPKGKEHVNESVDLDKLAVMPSLDDAPEDEIDSSVQKRAPEVMKVHNETEESAVSATPPVSPSSRSTVSNRDTDGAAEQNQASSGACGCECVLL